MLVTFKEFKRAAKRGKKEVTERLLSTPCQKMFCLIWWLAHTCNLSTWEVEAGGS
jgi:hypothetical protein